MWVILDEQQYAKYLEDWRLRGTKDGLTNLNRNNKNWWPRAEGYLLNSLLRKWNIWNSLCKKKKAFTLACSFAGWLAFVDLETLGALESWHILAESHGCTRSIPLMTRNQRGRKRMRSECCDSLWGHTSNRRLLLRSYNLSRLPHAEDEVFGAS